MFVLLERENGSPVYEYVSESDIRRIVHDPDDDVFDLFLIGGDVRRGDNESVRDLLRKR